jgi:hypothetical protein
VLTATATAAPSPSPSATPGPTATAGPIPAYTGRDGTQVSSAPEEQGGLPMPVLLGAVGLLVSGIGAGGFYLWRGGRFKL